MDKLSKHTITGAYKRAYEKAKAKGPQALHGFLIKHHKKSDASPVVKRYHACADRHCRREAGADLRSGISADLKKRLDPDVKRALQELNRVKRPESADRARRQRFIGDPLLARSCVPQMPWCGRPAFRERCGRMPCRAEPPDGRRVRLEFERAMAASERCEAARCPRQVRGRKRLEEQVYGKDRNRYVGELERARKAGDDAVHRLRLRKQRQIYPDPRFEAYSRCAEERCAPQMARYYRADIEHAIRARETDRDVISALKKMKKAKHPKMNDVYAKVRVFGDPVAAREYLGRKRP